MKRCAPSMASSFDFKSKIAYPPMTSLASVKGPSIFVSCPRESRMRVLTAVGASAPLATLVPALFASCPSLSMASINAWGGRPELSDDLTIIMNRIVTSPFFDSKLLLLSRLRHAATITTKPSWPFPGACTCPLHRSAEARTHPRQRPVGNLSPIGWPPPWSLPEGWQNRRRVPSPP